MSQKTAQTKKLTTLAMLTAVAYVVMILSKSLPQVSGFLQMDLKDVVICIGGFLFGPLSAAAVSAVVAVVEMFTYSDTGPIGCLMNVISTASFTCTAAFVYQRKHTRKGAVTGLAIATVVLTVVMVLWNYLITPIYMKIDRAEVVSMLPTVFLPFNLVKGGLNMAVTLLLYKPVVTALRRAGFAPESRAAKTQPAEPWELPERRNKNIGFLVFCFALFVTFATLMLVLMGVI